MVTGIFDVGHFNLPVNDGPCVFYDVVHLQIVVGFYRPELDAAFFENFPFDRFAQFKLSVFDVDIAAGVGVGVEQPQLLVINEKELGKASSPSKMK